MNWLISNPMGANTQNDELKEEDCPIIVKDKTIILKSKIMVEEFEYRFPFDDEMLMAIKHKDGTISIYELLERDGSSE